MYVVCMYLCMYVMYARMYGCMYVCLYTSMFACTYVCMYVCRYLQMIIWETICLVMEPRHARRLEGLVNYHDYDVCDAVMTVMR